MARRLLTVTWPDQRYLTKLGSTLVGSLPLSDWERSALSPCLARLTHEHSCTVRRRWPGDKASNSGACFSAHHCAPAWKTQNPVKCGGVLVYSVWVIKRGKDMRTLWDVTRLLLYVAAEQKVTTTTGQQTEKRSEGITTTKDVCVGTVFDSQLVFCGV